MNPGDNNPLNNTGAGATDGGAMGSSPLDFSAPAGSSSVNGLSMADSMAAAQDNLTSAGMAAPDANSNALGLDQISSMDPAASMATSDQPLVPAAPVPGSIGSVTSVPPLTPAPDPADSTAATGINPNNPFANTTTTTIAEGAGGVGSALPTGSAADLAKASEPVPPYNPFAAQPGAMPTTSSSSIPDALQPAAEKFTGDGFESHPLRWNKHID